MNRNAIKVRLHAPRGVGPIPNAESDEYAIGFNRDLEMPAVPREGDTIELGREDDGGTDTYRAHAVVWYPDEPDFDVYVVLR